MTLIGAATGKEKREVQAITLLTPYDSPSSVRGRDGMCVCGDDAEGGWGPVRAVRWGRSVLWATASRACSAGCDSFSIFWHLICLTDFSLQVTMWRLNMRHSQYSQSVHHITWIIDMKHTHIHTPKGTNIGNTKKGSERGRGVVKMKWDQMKRCQELAPKLVFHD